MRISKIFVFITFVGIFLACSNKEKTNNVLELLPDDSSEEIIRKASLVVPTEKQYNWQKLEYMAFIHFGPNTFTGVEWGNGEENPNVFNPTEFDASQWVSVIKDAGMKMAMLTVKHHDGYCLWQTTTSKHSVSYSSWKNGKGDVFGELVKEAHKENIKVGLYLSPADLHEIERNGGTYGNGSSPKKVKIPSEPKLQKVAKEVFEYELDDYNALFMNQLYELLTQYGKIEEVWFDGANPKPGLGQVYDRKAWYNLINKLQPDAVIAIKGPDVRWCGNEGGHTRKSEWSVLPLSEHPDVHDWPDKRDEDLGSREKLKDAKYLYWYPSETNTSVRIGWFYRDEEQYVKTVEEIVDTWYRSVGGNSVFLLNLTPNRKGLIPEKDANRLRQSGKIITEAFKNNLVKEATILASSEEKRNKAKNAIDGNSETCWKPENGSEKAELVLTLAQESSFNRLVLQECIQKYGQRIEEFVLDRWENGAWKEITSGTTVGYKSIRRFPSVTASKIRLRILGSRVAPTISALELYNAPGMLSNPIISRNKEGWVKISCKSPDPEIYYTIDGTIPNTSSAKFTEPFLMEKGGQVRAIAYVQNTKEKSEVIDARYGVCSAKWQIRNFSAEQSGHEALLAIDGINNSYWHTQWGENAPRHPHFVEIDLGETIKIKGFSYLPRKDGLGGICNKFLFEVSQDGINWEVAEKGTFGNIKNNPVNQVVNFRKEFKVKYIRFTSLSNINNDAYLSMAELGVF